ncbi:MAG: hypothetical protein IPM34_02355 [Saprospiraceae bacterium]|nr:hypothetical protein [Saprospiraceae bacterium]
MIKNYPSKILIAGEYTVLMGSGAFAVPFTSYHMSWEFQAGNNDIELHKFFRYLSNHVEFRLYFNFPLFEQDLQNGIYLKSNIPQGYGLGSSGAVCAAVWDRFRNEQSEKFSIEEIHGVLKQMESCFHGQSSGMDPLISFCRHPVFFDGKEFRVLENYQMDDLKNYRMALIDSGKRRDTQELVKVFNTKIMQPNLQNQLQELSELNKSLINSIITYKLSIFSEYWKKISLLSLNLFDEMIPENIRKFWMTGIEEERFYLKLCGAGGGGYFLAHVLDEDTFQELSKDHGFPATMPFKIS